MDRRGRETEEPQLAGTSSIYLKCDPHQDEPTVELEWPAIMNGTVPRCMLRGG